MRRRAGPMFALACAAAMLAVAGLVHVAGIIAPAAAQQGTDQNFLNPFPDNDVWRAVMIGDNLAEGLLGGLVDVTANEPRLQLQRRLRSLAALGRADIEDDARALEDLAAKEKIGIAFIMTGMADRWGIRLPNGRRLAVGQGDWRQIYAQRVDRVVRGLRKRGVAVYWVGLPMMRRSDWNEDIETINEVIRERTLSAGGRYVDAFKETGDEYGRFSDRGPDISGKSVRLRDPEGYDFTAAGYRKLAFFIDRQLRRDMNTAREERSIPLAGSEAEQRRNIPEAARMAVQQAAGQAKTVAAALKDARAANSPVARALSPEIAAGGPLEQTVSTTGDIKADNARVSFKAVGAGGREEQVTVEILRPAIGNSVIQLVTRRDKGDKPSQVGDTLVDLLSNGLLVMRSVTLSGGTQDAGSQRGSLTRQPFFIALSKGERLPPKPGRADDFRWPREDDIPPPPTAPPAATAAIASPVPLAQPAAETSRTRKPPPKRVPRGDASDAPSNSSPINIFQQ
jgi:hypothetical protein